MAVVPPLQALRLLSRQGEGGLGTGQTNVPAELCIPQEYKTSLGAPPYRRLTGQNQNHGVGAMSNPGCCLVEEKAFRVAHGQ